MRRTAAPPPPPSRREKAARLVQELRELGLRGTAFRVRWELTQRLGLAPWLERADRVHEVAPFLPLDAHPREVALAMRPLIPADRLTELGEMAERAQRGIIRCFGRWDADYGNPIDWHLNPRTNARWPADEHWSRALRHEATAGDVKHTWEVGRFPQAFVLARAATFFPERRGEFAASLAAQLDGFMAANPFRLGVHWSSGQEVVFRAIAWLFAFSVFGGDLEHARPGLTARASAHLFRSMGHVEEHRAYAEKAVHNNHLISEAVAGLIGGCLWPGAPEAVGWKRDALAILDAEARSQFYADGGYLQQSHTYERVALQTYLWATALLRQRGEPVPASWLSAMARGLEFLLAHQNPTDGTLPNYGANDGSLPLSLTTCDYGDFRPLIQAASIAARGERLYPPGPWDELSVWLFGPACLELPQREPAHKSASFPVTGHHVLRGRDPGSFAAFRCGSIRDRFSQIDMLHVDVWWRGLNVLVDGGSYQYNAAERWHSHFMRTGSHNTVAIDGLDQMLHHRRFKSLYWTRATLRRFEDAPDWALAEGEHTGYARHPGGCIHRRAVLFAKDDLWVVIDRVQGRGKPVGKSPPVWSCAQGTWRSKLGGQRFFDKIGTHHLRLHWLAGDFPHTHDAGRLTLRTPEGPFSISVLDERGAPLEGDVALGQTEPPRGWQSRYYGEKVAVPSLAVERDAALPAQWISVLGSGKPSVAVQGDSWTVTTAGSELNFRLRDGHPEHVQVKRAKRPSRT